MDGVGRAALLARNPANDAERWHADAERMAAYILGIERQATAMHEHAEVGGRV